MQNLPTYLVHETNEKFIESILKNNKLNVINKHGLFNYSEDKEINKIFMSVLFDYYKLKIPNDSSRIFLFFDISLLEYINPDHYCAVWTFSENIPEY